MIKNILKNHMGYYFAKISRANSKFVTYWREAFTKKLSHPFKAFS